ncbi:hypothetical protein [Chitinophaga rhizosphaerae]|uniref:hypothetical protein n=1 Tax=Chitinophaga rhizosphaerae TaxID=1864947 RepID=UPI000F800789|nr:hypothetical protein [Chitinophaga rhizosphaerae]
MVINKEYYDEEDSFAHHFQRPGSASFNKGLSSAIVDRLIGKQEIDTVIERDLTREAPPYLNGNLIGAFYKVPRTADEEERRLLQYCRTPAS